MTNKSDLKIEVTTDDCEEGVVWVHHMDQREGQSMCDLLIFAVEAVAVLYSKNGIKSINLIIQDE